MTRRRILDLMLCLALVSPVFGAGVARGASDTEQAEASGVDQKIDIEAETKRRREKLMFTQLGSRLGRYLKAAGEKMSEGDLAEAQRLLGSLNSSRLNPFERANLFRLQGYVAYQLGEQEAALKFFEDLIAEQALLLNDEVTIMLYVVQLNAAMGQWPDVLTALDRWERHVVQPTGLSYYLRAIAYYQLEDIPEALKYATKAVESSDEPEESWLQLQAALYVLEGDFAGVTPVLEQLVVRFPKKSYWVQLSLIYGAIDNYRESLSVQQVAYLQGFLTEDDELQRLARSYVFGGLPYEAANVLTEGLKSGQIEPDWTAYEFLANCWIQARAYDRSLEPLQIAADLAEGGDLYIRLGQVHMNREQWADAAQLFQKALAKGELTNEGNANLLLGISYFNDNQVGRARESFARARKYDKSRKAADDWLSHIDKESTQG